MDAGDEQAGEAGGDNQPAGAGGDNQPAGVEALPGPAYGACQGGNCQPARLQWLGLSNCEVSAPYSNPNPSPKPDPSPSLYPHPDPDPNPHPDPNPNPNTDPNQVSADGADELLEALSLP